jgi:hypothetical protein
MVMADAEQVKEAAEVYIYGYPLVYDLQEVTNFVSAEDQSVPFVDAWSNNFAYIGRRATGTAEATFLLTDRDHDGPVPDGMTVVPAPTGVFSIVGRVQVDGQADLPAVHDLQDQFTLTPLAAGTGGAAPEHVAGVPEPDPRVGDNLRWWEQFRVALAAFPPPAGDATFVALAERLGLTAT